MRLLIALAASCLLLGNLAGCAAYRAPVMPPMGAFFADIKAPMDADAEATKVSPKMGEATSTSILGLFATGDCSLNSAAQNGGIAKIEYIDYSYYNVLGVYQKFTTRVHGE